MRRQPSSANGKISRVGFKESLGVFLLLAKLLILDVGFNMSVGVFLEGLHAMKKRRSLLVIHEPFEVWVRDVVAGHDYDELLPNNSLTNDIHRLYVANGD